MAEESAVDSTSAAVDTTPLVEGEEPSNWANLPDGILQEVRGTLKGVARSSLHVRRVPASPVSYIAHPWYPSGWSSA